jgi:uncharacterized protein (DUF1697 family)
MATIVISMLRGVNVGSHKRMKMEALRRVYESLGLENPQTYLQSGNVVFKTRERDLTSLARRIESGIEQHFGFRSDVIIRTFSELRSVVARNPFAARAGIEPSKLFVTFLAGDCGKEAQENLRSIKIDLEEIRVDGRELYIYFPVGMGRSKLSPALIEKKLKTTGTGRNWNTITNLLAMAVNDHLKT